MDYISWEDFAKVEIKLGRVMAAEVPEGSEKVIKMDVSFGDQAVAGETRTIFAGIKKWFKPEDLVGKQFPFVTNIKPRKIGNLGESQGMLMAAAGPDETGEETVALLNPSRPLPDGSEVR